MEILIVIAILGVLSVVTVFAVRSITDRGETASCRTDRDTLVSAAHYYLADNPGTTIPATGVGVDRFERTLVAADILRDISTFHDLRTDGSVVSPGDPCP